MIPFSTVAIRQVSNPMKSNFCPAFFRAVLIPARDMDPALVNFSSWPYPVTEPPPWSQKMRHIRLAGKFLAPHLIKEDNVAALVIGSLPALSIRHLILPFWICQTWFLLLLTALFLQLLHPPV